MSADYRPLQGSESQIEWAERIRDLVAAEFDRVALAFRGVAAGQEAGAQAYTHDVVALVEKIRSEVLGNERAGYFIHDWQDISDQVRKMVFTDSRYTVLRAGRTKP